MVKNSSDLCIYLLNKANVALVPGEAFGSPNCVRLSYATSNELIVEAIKRIKKALAELKQSVFRGGGFDFAQPDLLLCSA